MGSVPRFTQGPKSNLNRAPFLLETEVVLCPSLCRAGTLLVCESCNQGMNTFMAGLGRAATRFLSGLVAEALTFLDLLLRKTLTRTFRTLGGALFCEARVLGIPMPLKGSLCPRLSLAKTMNGLCVESELLGVIQHSLCCRSEHITLTYYSLQNNSCPHLPIQTGSAKYASEL